MDLINRLLKIAGVFDEMDVLARAQFLEGFLHYQPFAKIRGATGKSQLLTAISHMIAEANVSSPVWASKSDTGLYRPIYMKMQAMLATSRGSTHDGGDLLQSMMGMTGWTDEDGNTVELGGASPFWSVGKFLAQQSKDALASGMLPSDDKIVNRVKGLAQNRAVDILRQEKNRAQKRDENSDKFEPGGEGPMDESSWAPIAEALFGNPNHPISKKFFGWLSGLNGKLWSGQGAKIMDAYLKILRSPGFNGNDTDAGRLMQEYGIDQGGRGQGVDVQLLNNAKSKFFKLLGAYLETHPDERDDMQDLLEDTVEAKKLFQSSMHTADLSEVGARLLVERFLAANLAARFAAKAPVKIVDPESGLGWAELRALLESKEKEFYEKIEKIPAYTDEGKAIRANFDRYRKDMGARLDRLRLRIQKAERGLRLSTSAKDMAKKPARGDWGYEGSADLKISAIVSSEGVVGWVAEKTRRISDTGGGNLIIGYRYIKNYTPYDLEGKKLPGVTDSGSANRALDDFADWMKKQLPAV